MPNYGSPQAGSDWGNPGLNLTSLVPGGAICYFFNNETPVAPQASIAVCYERPPLVNRAPAFFTSWAVAPSAFSLAIQYSNVMDVDAMYQTVNTVTTTPNTYRPSTTYQNQMYYRVVLLTNTGGVGLTVYFQP